MAIREGKWDCSYCGTTNLGRGMKCSACGRQRDPSVQFYLDDDAPEVTDEARLERARSGADWTCSFCGTDNKAGDTSCRQCHADKGESDARKTRIIPSGQSGSGGSGAAGGRGEVRLPSPGIAAKPERKRGALIPVIIGIVAVIALVFILVGVLGTRDVDLKVQAATWQRSINIENQQLNTYEKPVDQVPAGARVLSTRTVQNGTEKVQVGTEKVKTGTRDMGNGYFEDVYEDQPVYEDRPVYVDMATYEITEWVVTRSEELRGNSTDPPRWPEITLGAGEREGKRSESAMVILTDGDKEYNYSSPVADIDRYRPGSEWRATIGGLGRVKSLEAAP